MAPCCSHTVVQFYSLYLKSLAQKLTEKMSFFLNWFVRDYIKDQFSLYLKSLAEKMKEFCRFSANKV